MGILGGAPFVDRKRSGPHLLAYPCITTVPPLPESVNEMETTTDPEMDRARHSLFRAREGRQRGGRAGVRQCIDSAAEAHGQALDIFIRNGHPDAAVVMYHAHACVGRMHRYRAEHQEAMPAYRRALAVVEQYGDEAAPLKRWLAPAFHDCYVEARLLGQLPAEFIRWAEGRFDSYRGDPDTRLYAFVHDNAYMGADGTATDPRHLYDAARGAMWYAEDPFEKMVLLGSMALAAGLTGNSKWFTRAARLFDLATHDLASDEGVALQLLDVARGARVLGLGDVALELLVRCRLVSGRRDEDAIQHTATEIIGEMTAGLIMSEVPRPEPSKELAAIE